MTILISLTAFMVLLAFYVAWLRPRMRQTSWGQRSLDWVEPMERALWWKSETILWARAKILSGLLLTILTQTQTIDITPLMPLVPDAWEPTVHVIWNALPLTLTLIGWVDERLRKDTTKPLEIVGMRTDAPPEVKAAAIEADQANKETVAAVVEAKAV